MKILILVFSLIVCSQAHADRIADCYVDCFESIQFFVNNSSDYDYCRFQMNGNVVRYGDGIQKVCVIRETILLQQNVVGHGDCQSPVAWKRWKAQCELKLKKWAPGRCLSLVGLVSGKPRCE